MKKDNTCFDIIEQHALGWLFEKSVCREGILLKSALGTRDDGLQDSNILSIQDNYVKIYYNESFGNLESGSFYLGCFVSFINGTGGIETHTIIHANNCFKLYELGGNILFDIYHEGIINSVSTELSGINFCDGKTYLIVAYKDSDKNSDYIGIKVVDEYEVKLTISNNIQLSLTDDMIIGRNYEENEKLLNNTKLSGIFFLRGNMNVEDIERYYLKGSLKNKVQLFLKLDEGYGDIVYDCSGYNNHGIIYNYTTTCREINNTFINWKNIEGYSTGSWIIGKGISSLTIGGLVKNINSSALIPNKKFSSILDIFDKELEYKGRIRYNVRLEDILTFKSNGSTWGRLQDSTLLQLIPGTNVFSIWFCVEYIIGVDCLICLCGNKYKVEIISDKLRITIGGTYSEYTIIEGINRYIIDVTLTTCNVYEEGILLGSFTIGSTFDPLGNFDILNDGINITEESVIVFIGILNRLSINLERNIWFDTSDLPLDFIAAYYFYTKTNIIFDLTDNRNDIILQDYDVSVWIGRQSVLPYLCKGFTEIFIRKELQDESVIVPYSLGGKKIIHDAYGEGQYELEYKDRGGLLVFDAFVNFNPENKNIGFWTTFWNKLSNNIWDNLNTIYKQTNTFKWHLTELNMFYLLSALNTDYYNYVFSGQQTSKDMLPVELVDLVLLNVGNNLKNKPIII